MADEPFSLRADPPDSNLDETFLQHEFLLLFMTLRPEVKFSMLHLFTNQGFRTILRQRKLAVQDRTLNLNLKVKDPAEFQLQFAILRVELGFVDDLLTFMDQGLAQLASDFPEQFAPKANDLPIES